MAFRILKQVVCWVMVAACMIAIFKFSAQTAGESKETSNSVIKIIATALHPEFESLSEEKQNEIYDLYSNIIRKLAHFSIFGLLGFLVSLALFNYPLGYWRIFLYSAGICTLYAISDELHQMFVPERGPGVIDVLIDVFGALIGSLVIICIIYIIRSIIKKRRILCNK